MATYSESYSETSTTITFNAPQPPSSVRLSLRQKSLWARFVESTKDLSPSKILELFNDEKEKLIQKRRDGITLTKEELEFLNKNTRKRVKKVLNQFEERVLEEMEVKETDTADEIEVKLSFAEQLVKWLKDLFDWVIKKMKEIFDKIKEGLEWCAKQIKDLFTYLFSLFK